MQLDDFQKTGKYQGSWLGFRPTGSEKGAITVVEVASGHAQTVPGVVVGIQEVLLSNSRKHTISVCSNLATFRDDLQKT